MSGAAIVGAAAIGAGTSYMSAKSSSKSADKALASADASSALQYDISMQQLEFQQQRYSDWENIFGPVQENLSRYYKNLSSDSIASLGIQNIEQSYVQSRQNLDTQLAKRGISNSGATAAGLTSLENTRMLGKAEARTNAPQQAAQQQLGFLNAGLGLQSGLQQGISTAYGDQMNILGKQSSTSLAQATNYSNQAAQGYAGIGSSVGQGINSYMTYNALNPKPSSLNGQVSTLGSFNLLTR